MLFQAEEETLISHLHKKHFSSMELESPMSVHKATVIGESAVNIFYIGSALITYATCCFLF